MLGPGLASTSILAAIPAGTTLSADPDCHRPRADQLIELALRLWQGGQRDNLHTLEPRYLRRSAAEEKWAPPPRITAPTKP